MVLFPSEKITKCSEIYCWRQNREETAVFLAQLNLTRRKRFSFLGLLACRLREPRPLPSQEKCFYFLLYFLHKLLLNLPSVFANKLLPSNIGNSSSNPAYSSQLSFPSLSSAQFFPYFFEQIQNYLLVGDHSPFCNLYCFTTNSI
jgi:hypothetical protein